MELISVRELFKNTDAYLGKEIEVGGWVRSIRASKQFGFIVLTVLILPRFRWFITMLWRISRRSPKPMWALP